MHVQCSAVFHYFSSFRNHAKRCVYTNPDTIGLEESVLIREVSLFQGLKSTQTWYLGRKKVS